MHTIISLPVTVNMDRINHAINTLQQVVDRQYAFNITCWYSSNRTTIENDNAQLQAAVNSGDIAEVNSCGTAACVLGWIAATNEFKEAGGTVSVLHYYNAIRFDGKEGLEAGAAWFGDSAMEAVMYPGALDLTSIESPDLDSRLKAISDRTEEMINQGNEVLISAYSTDQEDPFDDQSVAITAQDAIEALSYVRDTGTIKLALYSF